MTDDPMPGAGDHSSGSRRLICLSAQGGAELPIAALQRAGWEIRMTGDPQALAAMIEQGIGGVGLFDLSAYAMAGDPLQMEMLLEAAAITWIALLPRELENHVDIWRLIHECCFDYHKLPIDTGHLLNTLVHANGMRMLKCNLQRQQHNPDLADDAIIGRSSVIQRLKQKLVRIAVVDAPVLIGGESGTGKELVARALHRHSRRAQGPFEAINCAALPATLIQSELFGYEKGAFTGANQRKRGLFELADGGTIFLDEIGDLSPSLQVILLRVLEQRVIRRLGGTGDIPVDVRVVAATHIDLGEAIKTKRFREDLYYRLNVLELTIPPLCERGEDVELLAGHFLALYGQKFNRPGLRLSAQARQILRGYDWPGNVRELINRIQRAVVMSDGSLIRPMDLGLERRWVGRGRHTLKVVREQAERTAIVQALRRTGNQVAGAARELGVSRVTVYRLMDKYGIALE